MSYGKRMLDAEARRSTGEAPRLSTGSGEAAGSSPSNHVVPTADGIGYLRSDRAFNTDGTPNRKTRMSTSPQPSLDEERVDTEEEHANVELSENGTRLRRARRAKTHRYEEKSKTSKTMKATTMASRVNRSLQKEGRRGAPPRNLLPSTQLYHSPPLYPSPPSESRRRSPQQRPDRLSARLHSDWSTTARKKGTSSPQTVETRDASIDAVEATKGRRVSRRSCSRSTDPPSSALSSPSDVTTSGHAKPGFSSTSPIFSLPPGGEGTGAERTTMSAGVSPASGTAAPQASMTSKTLPTSVDFPSAPSRRTWHEKKNVGGTAQTFQLPQGTFGASYTPRTSPSLLSQPTQAAVDAEHGRLPHPPPLRSPPLRAAIAPRSLPMRLSRLNSGSSLSLSLGPSAVDSSRTTPTTALMDVLGEAEDGDDKTRTPPSLLHQLHGTSAVAKGNIGPPLLPSAMPSSSPLDSPPPRRATLPGVGDHTERLSSSEEHKANGGSTRKEDPALDNVSSPRSSPFPGYRSRSRTPSTAEASLSCESKPTHDSGVKHKRSRTCSTRMARGIDGQSREDFSGFRNPGNDCYACSVLTFLLRNGTFRRALLSSPVVSALLRYDEQRRSQATSQTPSDEDSSRRCTVGEENSCALIESREQGEANGLSTTVPTEERGVTQTSVGLNEAGKVQPTVHGALLQLLLVQLSQEEHTLATSHAMGDTLHLHTTHPECMDAHNPHRLLPPDALDQAQALRARWMRCLTSGAPHSGKDSVVGIPMVSLASLMGSDFFSGEQEDAHEFYVSLITKLESESMDAVRCPQRLLSGIPGPLPDASALSNSMGHDGGTLDASCPASDTGCTPSVAVDSLWINQLLRGKLLNIIRCRRPGCQHEIVTEEPFVNLSLTIDSPSEDETPAARRSRHGRHKHSVRHRAPDIATLLRRSVQYERLDGYVCDACHSSELQFQGGCFYGVSPSLLVVQLKRFSITFNSERGELLITKNDRPVYIDEEIEVLSLPSEPVQHTPSTSNEEKHASSTPPQDSKDFTRCYYNENDKRLGETILSAERAALEASMDESNSKLKYDRPSSLDSDTEKLNQRTSEEQGIADKRLTSSPMNGAEDLKGRPEECVEAIRSRYCLKSVVLHSGKSLYCGHYVAEFAREEASPACVSDEEGEGSRYTYSGNPHDQSASGVSGKKTRLVWRLANDAYVTQLNPEVVAERRSECQRSYLLLYEKLSEEKIRCPVWRVLPRPLYE